MPEKGTFIISIDVELAWGMFDRGRHLNLARAYEKSRFIIRELLKLFAKYNISVTWAIVGHLFLDSCRKDDGIVHSDIIRPQHSWFSGDWFKDDPASDIRENNLWYGRDIIELIKEAVSGHEIASHSFSHIIFSDSGCSREAAESDIAKCVKIAQENGIKLDSFVFPRNGVGYLDLLSKYGFKAYRKSEAKIDRKNGRLLFAMRLFDLIRDALPIAPPVGDLAFDAQHNLSAIPQSMLFRYAHGSSKVVLPNIRFLKAKMALKKAAKEKKIFHLWFHPINFAWDTQRLLIEFEKILKFAAALREKGLLDILPMREVANRAVLDNSILDKFNPEGVDLHDERAHCFRDDYSSSLADYRSSAFKFGRKKILDDFSEVLGGLSAGSRVLDLGCGTGYFLNRLIEQNFKAIGVDLSNQMLKELKEANGSACVQRADARNLPFQDNTFDAVISIETIRYFSDRSVMLNEIFRVLKPNGLAFITAAPLFSGNLYGIFNTLCRLLRLKPLVSCYQSFETAGSLKRRLLLAGFENVKIKGHFFGPYFILDKISPRVSAKLISRFERFDDRLSKIKILRNFSNHLVVIARKLKK